MKSLFEYLNPIAQLGTKKYSIVFPLLAAIITSVISELLAYYVFDNPNIVGSYIIFLNVAMIIYFSFRDGIRAGVISCLIPGVYYAYIIITRNYTGNQLKTAVETSFVLIFLYLGFALTIGWLKERIDSLILDEKKSKEEAEEKHIQLQTILEQLPVGVLIADAKGLVVGNKNLKKIIGRRVGRRLNSNNDYRAPHTMKNNRKLLRKEWPIVRALEKGEIITGEELEYVREDHSHIFLKINAAPIKNKRGQILAAVTTILDITNEKDLEQRKDDFINMASHELKTPLTSMKIYLELLAKRMKKIDDSQVDKIIGNVQNQTNKLQDLVDDLLDVSRIHTGKLSFKKEYFDLEELVYETAKMFQNMDNGYTIQISSSKSLEVFGDRFRIYQVLTNLISNAIKYSPGKNKVVVKIKRQEKFALVSIKDFGIGIDQDQKKRIFERLYQVNNPKEKTFPGLGMGLYISREIIKRHRGKIWVESKKNQGSTFFFTIPLNK